jgi:hypothetical protein
MVRLLKGGYSVFEWLNVAGAVEQAHRTMLDPTGAVLNSRVQ